MPKYIPVIFLLILGVICRFLPHPANFAPIGAIAIFGGIYLSKKYALIIPLAAMLISDIFIGFYSWPIMLSVYSSFVLIGIIGLYIRKNKKFRYILGGTILGSILFFLITNWAVWAFGTLYPSSADGLWISYVAALPFFRNTLLGDLFYTAALVGGMEFILYWQNKKQRQFSTEAIRKISGN